MSCSESDFQYYCPKKQRNVFFDYYTLFNIDRCATEDQIKKAYRNLAKQYHPDKCNKEQKENSNEQFKIIGDAYQNLLNPERRSQYNYALNQMELKQFAKKYNYDSICQTLNCSIQELFIALGICINNPSQVFEYPCQEQKQQRQEQYRPQQFQQSEYQKQNRNNSTSQHIQNNNFLSSKTNVNTHSYLNQSQPILDQTINNNINHNNNGFIDDEIANEESEGEPQCQGSDTSSFFSNKSEQNFYQKFQFFNNYTSKQPLQNEEFTFLKGIFCNSDKQQNNIPQQINNNHSNTYEINQNIETQKQQKQEDSQQNLKQDQLGEWTFDFNFDQVDYNKASEMQSEESENQSSLNQQSNDEQEKKTSKNSIKKSHIQLLQKQNKDKKIVERIRTKQPVFSSFIVKRISKKN